MPAAWNTESKLAVNLASRSCRTNFARVPASCSSHEPVPALLHYPLLDRMPALPGAVELLAANARLGLKRHRLGKGPEQRLCSRSPVPSCLPPSTPPLACLFTIGAGSQGTVLLLPWTRRGRSHRVRPRG